MVSWMLLVVVSWLLSWLSCKGAKKTFTGCTFRHNVIGNWFLVRSVSYSTSPIVVDFSDCGIYDTVVYDRGGLVYGYNTLLHMDASHVEDNRVWLRDEDVEDMATDAQCTICLVLDGEIDECTTQVVVASITASRFERNGHALSGGVLNVVSRMNSDALVLLRDSQFVATWRAGRLRWRGSTHIRLSTTRPAARASCAAPSLRCATVSSKASPLMRR